MTHRIRIEERKAPEPGALDGFAAICESCGFIGASSLKSQAESMYGRGHQAYMASKES